MSESLPVDPLSSATPVVSPENAAVRRKLLYHLVHDRDMLMCEAMRILGSPDRAEDVLQDAVLRCLSSQALQRTPDSPCSYLRRMVRNLALDHYRKQKREIPCDAFAETLVCPATPVEQKLSAQEDLAHLMRALGALCPKRRYAFVEARLKAKQQTEIAREMNLSASRVHALIQSAQTQLEAALAETL